MKALIYLTVHSFTNRLKARLRKPLTYAGILFWVFYALMMWNSFDIIFSGMGTTGPEGYAMLLSFFIVWTIPANLLAYARKRGLAFKHCDVHFVFSAPISPKGILMYAQSKTLLTSLLLNLFVSVGGVLWFQVPPLKMVLFFLVTFVVETILEGCLMLIVFGNEFLGEMGTKILRGAIWACIIAMGALLLSQLFTGEFGFSMVTDTLAHPLLQLIPVIGWNIAFIRLLLIGPETLNMVCSVLYLATTVAAVLIAWRMKCTGQYFEDAMTFADEYEEALKRSKQGRNIEKASKKKKFKKAQVNYRGTGAKAIFYRQLLEYKKSRFFLLNYNSFIMLAISVIAIVATTAGVFSFDEMATGGARVFILPGISAYITFIFSGAATKWTKELQNPYTFLLPDSALRKMWYSTVLEHVKALLDGSILCVPLGLLMELPMVQILLCILIYTCLQANRLYIGMVCDGILAPLFGASMLAIFRMLTQGFIMALGIIGAVIGAAVAGPEVGFTVMIMIALIFAVGLALLGSVLFGRMESLENY